MRVLLIEDDEHVADALSTVLHQQGNDIVPVSTATEALADLEGFDLVLLDLGLPDLDGLEVCKRIRAASHVPIIVLTARTEEIDRVLALHAGADDYVTKPYSVHELRARMEAVTRRVCRCGAGSPGSAPSCQDTPEVVTAGPLSLDPRSRDVTLNGRPVQLTRKEFDLLAMLMEEPEKVHTRQDIISRVWDENWYGSTRTLDVHIGALRQKLGSYRWIETSRGVGFRLGAAVTAS
ncbi:DNA-binding response regulator [Streptomyces lucensis JCM 4490]|uniref:Sensory transduction protein RegX3 n=1 Tax=Streptomyces lucensis JCM 4490 TaxID=1306176 RepID=A0A918MV37_9ACTN|nr:response regulator transcription factor [Streptomyces lucensis]GGW72004.1 DNA-binding response regulator [Streptomyces lucensis JCM 4490]